MKNITVSVDDEVYRHARIKAAEADTSVSALVRRHLETLAVQDTEIERMKRLEQALRAKIRNFQGGARLDRDNVHTDEAGGLS